MTPSDPTPRLPSPPFEVWQTLRHPEARNYLAAALAGLVFVFGILLGRGSDVGAVLTAIFGLAGVFGRWPAAPPFVVILTTYFLLLPSGNPLSEMTASNKLSRGTFYLEDVILAAALVVYVGSQYRLLGVLSQAIPTEGRRMPKTALLRRPASAIPSAEVVNLLWSAVVAVAVGQLVWSIIASVRIDASRAFPFVLADLRSYWGSDAPGRLSPSSSRFVTLVGIVFAVTVAANLTFWYWRLRMLKPEEARMILQDTEWDENRRELARVARWKAWFEERVANKVRRARRKTRRRPS